MAFFTQRTGRGRLKEIKASYRQPGPIAALIPSTGSELAGIIGASEPAEWFATFCDKANGIGSVCLSPISGAVEWNQSGAFAFQGQSKEIAFASSHATSNCVATIGKTFENAKSFVNVVYLANVGNDDADLDHAIAALLNSYSIRLLPYRQVASFLVYTATPSVNAMCYAGAFSLAGTVVPVVFGWDARSGKGAAVNGGAKIETLATETNAAWSSAGDLRFYGGDSNGNSQVVAIGGWSGQSAESILDSLASASAKLFSALSRNTVRHTCSSSICKVGRSIVSSNCLPLYSSGLVIYPSTANLFAHSYKLSLWTASQLTVADWKSIDDAGIRTLSRFLETAATSEHKTSIVVTPVATGRHWLEFTSRMLNISACAITIDNGTESVSHSWDLAGAPVSYADGSAVVDVLDYRLFRIHVPIDLTTTDHCTITLRGLREVDEEWVDSYEGTATRDAYVGQWSFVRSEKPPLAVPVSLGTSATAIAPIVDWTDSKALNRLKNGRLSCKMRFQVPIWPAADVPLWTWRKDANNAVEVRLVYLGTTDFRLQFGLSLVVTQAGTAETVELDIGGPFCLERTNDDTDSQRDLTVSVVIDSAGLVKWVVRPEPDGEINGYEIDNKQVGEQLIAFAGPLATYAAPVPTSIRLGSSVAGTGQQPMTIVEVSTW